MSYRIPYFKPHFPWIVCKDGTELSVQCSSTHYCEPRDNDGPYTKMEVGYPSSMPTDDWSDYADGESISDSAVFGYVPTSLIQKYIDEHGGIDIAATINRWTANEKKIREEGMKSGRFWNFADE